MKAKRMRLRGLEYWWEGIEETCHEMDGGMVCNTEALSIVGRKALSAARVDPYRAQGQA